MESPTVVSWPMRIRPEKISWLRFILEGYDGLALLSTISVSAGLVQIQTLDCRFTETWRLLEQLADQLTCCSFPNNSVTFVATHD